MKPLYIWAGGKTKMIPKYLDNPGIPTQGYDTFVEPFFGGGAMTLWVKQNVPSVKNFVINDIKSEVMGIYNAIKHNPTEFCDFVDNIQEDYLLNPTKDERKSFYYVVREEYMVDYAKWNPTQESAVLYFLMKTAFNGIWQTTKKSKGRFATPFGLGNQTNKIYDKELVLEWHDFLQQVTLYNDDWKTVCDDYADGNCFFFFDPPYRGSFTTYGEEFNDDSQDDLVSYCSEIAEGGSDLVFLCNRDVGDGFFDSVPGLTTETYDVKYTAGRRKKTDDGHEAKAAQEVLLHNIGR